MGKDLGGCTGHHQVEGINLAAFEGSGYEAGRENAARATGDQYGQLLSHSQLSRR